MTPRRIRRRSSDPARSVARICLALIVAIAGMPAVPAEAHETLDPAHNAPLPCELVSTIGLVPRSAKDIQHLANVCGFVGTDVEFQSRTDARGRTRDYAFVGTMGAGLRIFEITEPARPVFAGGYLDPGWQGDVQVRGEVAVVSFDAIAGRAPTLSACLQGKLASGGEDIIRLSYDGRTGRFTTSLIDCVSHSPGGGAHNATLHPSGSWLAVSNPRLHGSVDVVDLRGAPTLRYRIVQDSTLANSACTTLRPPARCVSNGRSGTWSPHDVHFSADGNTMYAAAVSNDTVILDVANALAGTVATVAIVPNDRNGDGGVAGDPHDISISHQSDVSADGKVLVITDERGGGLGQTQCNTDPSGIIGGAHFWALAPIEGRPETADASPANPRRLGAWFYPNPLLALDPLAPALAALPRGERGCTIHVLRLGGNGTASPGPIEQGFDGVSRLPIRQAVTAHYGAGVWWFDFGGSPAPLGGEDPRTTWGRTLGWNVMPGADTWSAKEYKGHIYAGDMARGFDVYRLTPCVGDRCVPPEDDDDAGRSDDDDGNRGRDDDGAGRSEDDLSEMTVDDGMSAGGTARFGFSVSYVAGAIGPTGYLRFVDRTSGREVRSTAIHSFTIDGTVASFSGLATVNGGQRVRFFAQATDLSALSRASTFRIWLGDGYGATGTQMRGRLRTVPALTLADAELPPAV